ncbi:MAG: hypothetical protein IJS60_08225 [Abditibacteriota bacterium]|nr:hypothetical protein [Abditibacteriota bacterium]
MSDLENKDLQNVDTEKVETKNKEVISEDKPKFKLNPEIKGMIGIFVVIFVLGLIMAISMGKLEQWFGVDIFAGAKVNNKIIYIEEGDKNKIASYDLSSGKNETILEEGDIKDVAVSYTGKKLAFVAYEGETPQVFIMNPDGKKRKVITTIEGSKAKPKFSPDGKYISYIANGRVFRADLNGSNSFSMLPTRQEQSQALNGRDGKLVMKDYVWSYFEGMLGVVSRGEDDERLVLMSDNNGDAHEIPFPEGLKCSFISLSASTEVNAYIAVAKSNLSPKGMTDTMDNYMLFLVQVPEEHNHANESMSMQDMGVAPIPMGKDRVSYAILMSNGMVMSLKPSDPKMPAAIYMLDGESGQASPLLPFFCDKFEFIYNNQILLHNISDKLQILRKDDTEPKVIGNKVQSYSVAPQKEVKK